MKSALLKGLALQPDSIKRIHQTPSGYALILKDEPTAKKILEDTFFQLTNKVLLERQVTWFSHFLTEVPENYRDLDSLYPITPELVTQETTLQTGCKPVRVIPSQRSPNAWIV